MAVIWCGGESQILGLLGSLVVGEVGGHIGQGAKVGSWLVPLSGFSLLLNLGFQGMCVRLCVWVRWDMQSGEGSGRRKRTNIY